MVSGFHWHTGDGSATAAAALRQRVAIGSFTRGFCSPELISGRGVDDMSLVKPLPCNEQFGKRGHQWKSAVPPSLSEATHGPWHEMSNKLSNAATFPAKRQMTEEKITMKAIVVTDQAAGTAGMKLVERPEPQAAINDVVVQVHASGFTSGELTWPSTWTDRLDRDRTPSIPGQELAGVVTALGYGTTGLSVGQRVFGLTDSYRGGTLAEYVAVEARNLAPLPGDVDFTVGASVAMPGLTAWQGLFDHGRLQAGHSVLVHGAAGSVGSMVTQLAREA